MRRSGVRFSSRAPESRRYPVEKCLTLSVSVTGKADARRRFGVNPFISSTFSIAIWTLARISYIGDDPEQDPSDYETQNHRPV